MAIIDTKNLTIEKFRFENEDTQKVLIRGGTSGNIHFKDVAFTMDEIDFDEQVDKTVVVLE